MISLFESIAVVARHTNDSTIFGDDSEEKTSPCALTRRPPVDNQTVSASTLEPHHPEAVQVPYVVGSLLFIAQKYSVYPEGTTVTPR